MKEHEKFQLNQQHQQLRAALMEQLTSAQKRIKELEQLNKSHQELNGKLQLEIARLKGAL
jgi:endonuclease V-like protein UPF0215 family